MDFEHAETVEKARELARELPVAIVFANAPYQAVLANWVTHARATGASNILVLALDDEILGFAEGEQIVCSLLPPVSSRQELWLRRVEVFTALAEGGVNFIHSDADAVWLRSPYEYILPPGVDMAFSQGTRLPPDIAKRWGFVLCCGFFAVRGNRASTSFFKAVHSRMAIDADDQVAVNRTLHDLAAEWQPGDQSEMKAWNGRPLEVFKQLRIGTADDFTVALLPHFQFARLEEISPETIVSHPVSSHPASDETIEHRLRRLGLWRVA